MGCRLRPQNFEHLQRMEGNRNLQYNINAILAILVGLGLIIGETIRRYGAWGFWARWMDDYIMGGLLIVPAVLILKKVGFGKRLLIAGWGAAFGMTFLSFFGKISPTARKFETNIDADLLVFLIGLAFATSLIGLIWLLLLERKEIGSR